MATSLIRVTDETTREELLVAIALLTAEAKKVSRSGAAFVKGNKEYGRQHERINALIGELESRV